MTSFPQSFDINSDPFIVTGRKIINSLNLQVASKSLPRPNGAPGFVACDSHYLYFDDKDFSDIYFDFLNYSLANKIEFHAPVRVIMGGKPLVSTFYKLNFRFVDEKIEPHFWDNDATLKVKAELMGFLDEHLVSFYYDYISF